MLMAKHIFKSQFQYVFKNVAAIRIFKHFPDYEVITKNYTWPNICILKHFNTYPLTPCIAGLYFISADYIKKGGKSQQHPVFPGGHPSKY